MNLEFIDAMNALEKDRHISKEVLIDAIESALVSAYKKNYGTAANVRVQIDRENGETYVLMRREIVEEVLDDFTEMSLEEAREIDARYEIGDAIEFQVMPKDFGRIAAQTAKQVVIQRLREAERGMVYEDYITRQGQLITGTVSRLSGATLFVNIGTTEGMISPNEQVRGETWKVNDRIRSYIMDVKNSAKGPQVFLSRSHPGFVKGLFEMEVPEIADGIVEIMGIAREAGSRTKIAVWSEDSSIDPVGSCVGAGGSRVQAIVDEINGEKIDVIPWSYEPRELVAAVLRPAKVEKVIILKDTEKEHSAVAIVPDYQLSLAIGKEGQNVRLAAKVSGWKIDIKSTSQMSEEDIAKLEAEAEGRFTKDAEGFYVLGDDFTSLDDELKEKDLASENIEAANLESESQEGEIDLFDEVADFDLLQEEASDFIEIEHAQGEEAGE